MVTVITLNTLFVWFLWGFFMGIGWAIGTWVINKLLGRFWP